jgi:putative DNA primase/helicase
MRQRQRLDDKPIGNNSVKPDTFAGDPGNIPAELKQLARWAVWQWTQRGTGWSKPPYQLKAPAYPASTKDPKHWGAFSDALKVVADERADGVSLNLNHSGYGALDLDHCRDPIGNTDDWAQNILAQAAQIGAYVEITPSGTGYRVIGRATGTDTNRAFSLANGSASTKLEVFRNTAKPITVTGAKPEHIKVNVDLPNIDQLIDNLVKLYSDQSQQRRANGADTDDCCRTGYTHDQYETFVREGCGPDQDRSAIFHATVWHYAAKGLGIDEIVAQFEAWPDGIAARYIGEDRLRQEVERSFKSWRTKNPEPEPESEPEPEPQSTKRAQSTVVTEDSAALQFVEMHLNDLRFDHNVGAWFRWIGTHWQRDETQLAFAWARELARKLAKTQDARGRYITSKMSFAANVERGARNDQSLATTQENWDANPMLLGTPGGTVDLTTGKLCEANPGDMITKVTAVAPSTTADCPTWLGFLDRVTGNSEELRNYIQRVSGYALTGLTTEHAMFFNYGTGANGKSVLMGTLAGILKDYHRAAAIETFTVASVERHPTDLAGLRGARLVTVTETEEGRRWAQSRIAQITGGDMISARFMRQDYFDYIPSFKLWISGNHKPGLRSVNEAIRRRMNMLPFAITIPEGERDKNLPEKLKAEWPGILRWVIEGCVEWQRIGLSPPTVVTEATAAYLEAEDVIQAWIEDCCDRKKSEWQTIETLHSSYRNWAAESEEYDGGKRWFGKSLEDRGFDRKKRHGNRGHIGLRVRVSSVGNSWDQEAPITGKE